MNRVSKGFVCMSILATLAGSVTGQEANPPQTYCNPLNLDYRFMMDAVDAREAADPVMVLFKNDYYLFASRSGGYWYSNDFIDWTLVIPNKEFPIEVYAPAVLAVGDSLYYAPSAQGTIWVTADPKGGVWKKRANIGSYGDPDLFLDDDGRVYMYSGLSNANPTQVVELDVYNNFKAIGKPVNIVFANAAEHGWERRGDDNLLDEKPWIEGSWMTKHAGRYYLQYAAPGTEFKTYADGIYVSDLPLGPFTYAPYSPFSFKSTGFISGAGHSSTFQDKGGRWWHISTMCISVRHMFERRLGVFPVEFDADGVMHANTEFGDYPQYLPGVKADPASENFTGWMLLSRGKYAKASSLLQGYGVEKAVDENVKTFWAAQTGDPGEWLQVDLGKACSIRAIQVNFGEQGTDSKLVRGRTVQVYEQYTIEISPDSLNWTMLIDKSTNTKDVPHDYLELAEPATARYVKLTNVLTPGNGKFCVRDLRLFGNPAQASRVKVTDPTVMRDPSDGRNAVVIWDPLPDADGYIIRYGIALDKLYNNYMVYDADSIAIHSLNKGVEYYFEVESFDGGTEYYRGIYSAVDEKTENPAFRSFSLEQNYPNPFNPVTKISYSLPQEADVRLDIFNLRGQRVSGYSAEKKPAGSYLLTFDGAALPSGVYIYHLQTGDFAQYKKMVLLK
jgi:xylan 1,4-beta-xylosidase